VEIWRERTIGNNKLSKPAEPHASVTIAQVLRVLRHSFASYRLFLPTPDFNLALAW
jgi:hypothetical protein